MPSLSGESAPDSSTPRRSRRAVWIAIFAVVGVLAVLYVCRLGWLSMMATEGAVPPASAVQLPAGSTIISEVTDCASGGCWKTITVQPPAGQTPATLAEELGATPQTTIPGNAFDPRTVWVSANASHATLVLTLDYWSGEWVP